jgi:hypothetical protein
MRIRLPDDEAGSLHYGSAKKIEHLAMRAAGVVSEAGIFIEMEARQGDSLAASY